MDQSRLREEKQTSSLAGKRAESHCQEASMEEIFSNNLSQAEMDACSMKSSESRVLAIHPSIIFRVRPWSSGPKRVARCQPSHPWSRWQDGGTDKKEGERTHIPVVFSERFLEVATKCFCLYLTGQILITWPRLAARKAGKYCLYSRWPNAHSESELLVLREKGTMDIRTQKFLSQSETFAPRW